MYIPKEFIEADSHTLQDFMRAHSFATLVTTHDAVPFASHLPLMLDSRIGSQGGLLGHMARNNPQWQDFAAGMEILVIFNGAHAYVSPNWYEPNPMTVPTWNFSAVHAYGKARILPEAELEATLHILVDEHEKAYPKPWKLALTPVMRERMLSAIVGFEIKLTRIEGKFKLSQNRSEQDQRNVISKLTQSEFGRDVAQSMLKNLERK
ncbi:MAG: FMN-binding negative transcriptional regulator [Gallionella sp.]|nr:FMN-binding negative transcriptional regulator [Gallionella sp.]